MKAYRHMTIAAVAAVGLALAGCGGGGSSDTAGAPPVVEPMPTAYETATAAIAAAATAEDAQKAVDDAAANVSGAELRQLQAAADGRVVALNMAAAAEVRKGLVDAAMCTAATAACRDAHQALVSALQADLDALKAKDDATNAEEQAAQMALDEAQTALDEVASALAEIDQTTATGMAVAAAETAAGGLADDRSAQNIADAKEAIEAAKTAVGDSEDYNDRIAAANMAVARAEELNMVDAAIMAARDAAHDLADDSGVDAVAAAQAAIKAATMVVKNAEHLTDAETTAYNRQIEDAQAPVTVAKNANDAEAERMRLAAEKAKEDKAKTDAMAATAAGKALKKALGNTPLANLTNDAPTGTLQPNLGSTGLTVGIPAGAGDDPPAAASPRMKAGASAGSLGSWKGTHYAHKNPGTKVSNSAIVYTNQAAPTVKPFASGASFGDNQAAFDGAYTASTRTLALGTTLAATRDVKGDMFPTAGEKIYSPDPVTNAVVIRGTYQGAPGSYRCSGPTCEANASANGAIALEGGTWVFVHNTGAMTSKPDANYLYFGWWLQKNKDDEPTSASAFVGVRGDVDGDTTLTDPATYTGSATYVGAAAGKFAISDPLNGGDAGHFTADATLTAKFGGTGAAASETNTGVSGTLENFMANDKEVPWSVALHRAPWGTDGAFTSTSIPTDTTAQGTTWSIDGNSAAETGSWSGQMYDEKPGNAPMGDGSNVPTSVTGTFQSHFGSTHTMVGAFGAEKDE